MSGKLYVVGTPIGNLGDMSQRALETLMMVDFIAAEDTRVTVKLLNHFAVKKPLISYFEHNLKEKGELIVQRIEQGENCAIVTDAGMPCISDPGEDLVALCAARDIPVLVVPLATAAMSALAISGLPTSRFAFEGFLSTNKKNRIAHLQQIKNDEHTLIFYEAPHKLLRTLEDMLEQLGDRKISLCRELTKIHEEVVRTTLSQAVARYTETEPRGEFVLIVEGAAPVKQEEYTLIQAVELAQQYTEEGQSKTQAAKQAAKQTGYAKSEIYKQLI